MVNPQLSSLVRIILILAAMLAVFVFFAFEPTTSTLILIGACTLSVLFWGTLMNISKR